MTNDRTSDAPARPRVAWFLLVGALSAVVGLLPWLTSGPFLPLQNLENTGDASRQGPFVLLPYSQYQITTIIVLLVVGGVAAGIAARALGSRPGVRRGLATVGGLALAQLVAIIQTTFVTAGLLQERLESVFYIVLLVAVAVVALAVSLFSASLLSTAPRAGAGVALSIGAMATGIWIGSWMTLPFGFESPFSAILPIVSFLGPALVGVVIAWTGIGTAGQIVAALVGLLLVWVVPALETALASAAGTRVLAHSLPDMADYGVNVFFSALALPDLTLRSLAITIVVAIVGLVLRRWVVRRGDAAS
jgi:hypothetical protein